MATHVASATSTASSSSYADKVSLSEGFHETVCYAAKTGDVEGLGMRLCFPLWQFPWRIPCAFGTSTQQNYVKIFRQ